MTSISGQGVRGAAAAHGVLLWVAGKDCWVAQEGRKGDREILEEMLFAENSNQSGRIAVHHATTNTTPHL